MKKVVNVTIGKTVFVLEDDAYDALKQYLDKVGKYFSKQDDAEEIVEDIEISFAEKFMTKRKNRDTAITIKEVTEAIEEMGSVEELTGAVENEDPIDEEKREKVETKLFRDPDNEIVAGVASGLANYFGIDPVIVRLIFFLSVFMGGFGAIMYGVLWIIMPEAKTQSQKYQMRGEKLTLEKIEDSLKKGREKLKKKDLSGIKGGLERFFAVIGGFLRGFLECLRWILGMAMSVGGVLAIALLAFLVTVFFTGGHLFFFEERLDFIYEWFEGVSLYAFLGVALVIVVIPLIFIFKGGLLLLRKKNLFGASDVVTLVILWFVALGVASAFLLDIIFIG